MRFDDRLTTLLDHPDPQGSGDVALWRQLVDLLAQGHIADRDALANRAFETVRQLRDTIPLAVRRASAMSFRGLRIPPFLLAFFADDVPLVAIPILSGAKLSTDEWIEILPRLGPTARGLLRHREDLSPEVKRALESFGASDFVLEADKPIEPVMIVHDALTQPMDVEELPVPPMGETQIRDLMARIDAFQSRGVPDKDPPAQPVAAPAAPTAPVEEFRFESGADGTIRWVAGAPRGPLIGQNIAVATTGQDHGVDGQVAGAYRKRSPFRDGRLTLPGESAVAGEWRVSGVPVFGKMDGRFLGYRCAARRPRTDEVAPQVSNPGVFGTDVSVDSVRQLVHELRTPLSAIIGFSEMIEGQFLGPAASGYRDRAADISLQGRRLLTAIEDLDVLAKADAHRLTPVDGEIDPAKLLERLHDDHQAIARQRGFRLRYRLATDLGMIAADAVSVERMFGRLLSAVVALAQRGEQIRVELDRDPMTPAVMLLAVDRPVMIKGRDERTLLDPGYNPNGDSPDAPVLGLGFALRLVRSIALACGGALDIDDDRLVLKLPLRMVAAQAGKGQA